MNDQRRPEGSPSPSPREVAAAAAIRAVDAQWGEGDDEYPSLTEQGSLRLATAAIAAAQAVDIENGIERIRRSEIFKAVQTARTDAQESCPTRLMDGRNEIRCWLTAGHEGNCK